MSIASKIIDEIKSQKHETMEQAIDNTVTDHPEKTEDYYFLAFDINNDPAGEGMDVEKVKIAYKNELQLMGAIGKHVTEKSENDMYVMFLNKKRAVHFADKVRQWEKEYVLVDEDGNYLENKKENINYISPDRSLAIAFFTKDEAKAFLKDKGLENEFIVKKV